jgi:WD40 repeat protein
VNRVKMLAILLAIVVAMLIVGTFTTQLRTPGSDVTINPSRPWMQFRASSVSTLDISWNGRYIMAVNIDGFGIWDRDTRQKVTTHLELGGGISRIIASPVNDTFLVIAGYSEETKTLISSYIHEKRPLFPTRRSRCATYHPSGNRIASAEITGGITILDASNGNELARYETDGQAVNYLSYSQDGSILAACLRDGSIKTWDSLTGTMRCKAPSFSNGLIGLAIPTGNTTIAAIPGPAGCGKTIGFHDINSCRMTANYRTQWSAIYASAIKLDSGLIFLSVLGPGGYQIWSGNISSGIHGFKSYYLEKAATSLAVSRDGGWMAAGTSYGALHLYDVKNLREIFSQ